MRITITTIPPTALVAAVMMMVEGEVMEGIVVTRDADTDNVSGSTAWREKIIYGNND